MGTRCLTVFVETWEDPDTKEMDEKEIVVMYRQFDGYPTGHGAELKEFLDGFKVGNGIPCGVELGKFANGMSCLAAQTIAHFKGNKPGGFYLYPAGERNCGEEYVYTLRNTKDGKINLQVRSGMVTFFGLPGTKEEDMGLVYDGDIRKFDPEKAEKVKNDIRAKLAKKPSTKTKR